MELYKIKKLFLTLLPALLILLSFEGVSQSVVPRMNSGSNTAEDRRVITRDNWIMPRYADTIAANLNIGIDSCGAKILTYEGGANKEWTRMCLPTGKRWVRIFTGDESSGTPLFTTRHDSIPGNDTSFIFYNNNGLIDTVEFIGGVGTGGGGGVLLLTEGITLGGLVTWSGEGLTYDVTPAWYVKNQTQYYTPASQFTLNAADDTYDRIDVPAVNTTPAVIVVPGEPAAQPVIPQVDPSTDIPLTSIIVPVGATIPSNITQTIWYDVNAGSPTEANWAASGTPVNFGNLINAYHSTHAMNVSSWTANVTVTGTWATTVNRNDLSLLKMAIDLKGNMSSTANIIVRFINNTTTLTTNYTLTSANGFTKTDIGYQNVVVPLSAIAFPSSNFNKVQIILTGAGPGMYIDYVQFQGGINPGGSTGGNEPIIVTATGDASGTSTSSGVNPILPLTLATVNPNVGSFVNANITVNAKGLITAAANGGGGTEFDPNAWLKLGNSGTDSAINFVGTIDAKPLNIRTWNVQRFSFAKDRPEIQTYNNTAVYSGGGFYVNGGNRNIAAVQYPGANMAIGGGHDGGRVLDSITTGYWNIAIGDRALMRTKEGYDNVAIGFRALENTVGGFRNTFIGSKAGGDKTQHYADVAIGDEAMMNVAGSHDNVAVGSFALRGEWGATIHHTTAVGIYACAACGPFNVAVGANAMQDTYMEGIENVNVGAYTCGTCGGIREMAKGNVVLGYMAGFEGLTGDNNNVMGRYAGAYNNFGLRMSGSRNNIFGSYTNGYVTGADGNIALGSYISNPGGIGADATLSIGNVIFGSNMYNGTSPSSTPVVGGKIGIRVKIPLATLHIDSDTVNVSGLRFERLTSATPTGTGAHLGVDANGKVITVDAGGGGGAVTANNGLNMSTATNVQLGGALVANTTITPSGFTTTFNSPSISTANIIKINIGGTTASSGLDIAATSQAKGINVVSADNSAITAFGVQGKALDALSTWSTGLTAASTNSNAIEAYGNSGGVIASASASSGVAVQGTANGAGAFGVRGISNAGIGIQANSTTGLGLGAASVSGRAAVFGVTPTSTNTVVESISVGRGTSGTPANGIGVQLSLTNQTSTGSGILSNAIISKWTDITHATRTSEFSITTVNGGTESAAFTLAGTGQLTLNKYTTTVMDAVATKSLGVDATGKVVTFTGGGGGTTETASNGLNKLVNDIKMGGPLTENTTITGGAYQLLITGSNSADGELKVTNSGHALRGASTDGYGVYATSSDGQAAVFADGGTTAAGYFQSTAGSGVQAYSFGTGEALYGNAMGSGVGGYIAANTGVGLQVNNKSHTVNTFLFSTNNSNTNAISPMMRMERQTTGAAAVGIGMSIEFTIENTTTGSSTSNKIISKWTDASYANKTSEFSIWGVNNGAAEAPMLTLAGTGQLTLNSYTGTTMNGTATKSLGVDATGKVVTFTGSGPALLTQVELIKRMTTPERVRYRAIEGEIVYDKTTHSHWFWNGTIWKKFN